MAQSAPGLTRECQGNLNLWGWLTLTAADSRNEMRSQTASFWEKEKKYIYRRPNKTEEMLGLPFRSFNNKRDYLASSYWLGKWMNDCRSTRWSSPIRRKYADGSLYLGSYISSRYRQFSTDSNNIIWFSFLRSGRKQAIEKKVNCISLFSNCLVWWLLVSDFAFDYMKLSSERKMNYFDNDVNVEYKTLSCQILSSIVNKRNSANLQCCAAIDILYNVFTGPWNRLTFRLLATVVYDIVRIWEKQ